MACDHIQQIRNQPENDDIPEEPAKLRFAPYYYLNFINNILYLIDIIDNIVYRSVSRDQNSYQ